MTSRHSSIEQLDQLRALPVETEWVEFKEAKHDFHFDKLGQYFSALANEANLCGKPCGWLVLGIANSLPRAVVGTAYRPAAADLQSLKQEVSRNLSPAISFMDIHEVRHPAGRVLMLQVPPAPRGIPVAWNGHYYGRNGESLVARSIAEQDRIRAQAMPDDWSGEIIAGATLDDLDPAAVALARTKYEESLLMAEPDAGRHERIRAEVVAWDTATLLNKAKITKQGRITRAALLLLGKGEAVHFLAPADAKISWILRDADNRPVGAPRHFWPPFLLASDALFRLVRNVTLEYMPNGTLFPTPIPQYDAWVIREALHNCIAHQDYRLGGKINVVEHPDRLVFSNLGGFIPPSVEWMLEHQSPPEHYRNQWLINGMIGLRMVDQRGGGIRRMFETQRERFFPLPDYDIDAAAPRVELTILGKILDANFTQALMKRGDLGLREVILLDRVQKRQKIAAADAQRLRAGRLIEGRAPNYFVSAKVAEIAEAQSSYIRNRGLDKGYYKQLIVERIRTFGPTTRRQLNELLLSKLPDVLSEKQKLTKIGNLLAELARKDGLIRNAGSDTKPSWVLVTPANSGNQ